MMLNFSFFFHYDAALCSPKDKPYPLEFYLHWDYVGAPWGGRGYNGLTVWTGNGGFSLRNLSLAIHCIENCHKVDGYHPSAPEDYFFAYCAQLFGHACPYDYSKYFAIETEDSDVALGVHGICTYARHFGCNKDWMNRWLSKCPDSSYLFPGGTCSNCQ